MSTNRDRVDIEAENLMDYRAFYRTFLIDPPAPRGAYYLSRESPRQIRGRVIAEAFGAAFELGTMLFLVGLVFGVLSGWAVTARYYATRPPTPPTTQAAPTK